MLHQIGAGALGPVFRAYQPSPGRLVAIKQFRLDLTPGTAENLVGALQQIVDADLTQPGIAAPIAAGLADGTPYLAMDFVAAESFDVVMREYGPAHAKEAFRLARQLGSALDSAAAIGAFHGALHPRDVLMAVDDVRLTGLGIAQVLESVGVPAPIRPPYAAPERTAGVAWDRRADTFSLAALVYEMLVGRKFATAERGAANGLASIQGVDTDRLGAVFARGLAESPQDRFGSAREFSDALERALVQPPSRAKASSALRKRGADTPPDARPLLADLPLEFDSDTAPVFHSELDDVLEMSTLDAALPPLVSSAVPDEMRLNVRLTEGQPSDPDLVGVDTRLDAALGAPLADLDLGSIHVEHFEQLGAVVDEAPILRLDALDDAAEAAIGATVPMTRDVELPETVSAEDGDGPTLRLDSLDNAMEVPLAESPAAPRHADSTPGNEVFASVPDAEDTFEQPTLRLDAAAEAAVSRTAATDDVAFIPAAMASTASEAMPLTSAGRVHSDPIGASLLSTEVDADPSGESDLASEVESPVPTYGTPFARSAPLGGGDGQGTGNWSILLGVVVGLLVGFAFGYGYGLWRFTGNVLTTASSESEVQASTPLPRGQAPATAQTPAPASAAQTVAPASSSQAGRSVQGSAPAGSPPRAPAAPAAPAAVPASARGSRGAAPPATPAAAARGAQNSRPPADGRLILRTTPAGARVTIDGRDVGITPLTTASLPPGQHVVRLAHQGYVAAERRVRIGSAQPAQSIDVELVARPAREIAASSAAPERTSGSLTFDSRPTGARVFVDEALLGTTPLQIDAITSGDHAVRFELDGFGPWSTTVRVVAGARTRVSGSLER
ncbi:MAG: PEGA domain-containing protein [Vicinamibacterales bacterium]